MGEVDMQFEENTSIAAAKAERIAKECLRPSGVIPRCIDDRDLRLDIETSGLPDFAVTRENFTGPQFLGGSLGILALVAEAMAAQQPDTAIDFDQVYTKLVELHQAAGLQLGVHMDDHHGQMSSQELAEILAQIMSCTLGDASLIPGCGFAGLLSSAENPLGLSPRVSEFFQRNPNSVDELVKRGAKLSILTGNHAPRETACAVENKQAGITVNPAEAIAKGIQTYNHDTGTLTQLLAPMGTAAETLLAINSRWLATTTGILANMAPVSLPAAAV